MNTSSKAKKPKTDDPRVFYITVLAAVAAVQLALKALTTFVPETTSQTCSRIMEGVLLIVAVYFVRRTTFAQPWLGLRVEKAARKRTLLTCLLLAAGIVAVFAAARLVMQQFSSDVAARPFFRFYLNIKHRRYYLFFVLLQEVLAKGILQYGIEKTLPDRKPYAAIAVAALVFGMLHIYHTLYYVLGAVAIAVVTGILYRRQRNVWSSVTVHFLIAFLPRCFGLK